MSSVNGKKKKNVFFAIETHDQALLAIKRSSIALFVIAAIQLVIGFTFYPTFPGELLIGTYFCVTFGFALMVLKNGRSWRNCQRTGTNLARGEAAGRRRRRSAGR